MWMSGIFPRDLFSFRCVSDVPREDLRGGCTAGRRGATAGHPCGGEGGRTIPTCSGRVEGEGAETFGRGRTSHSRRGSTCSASSLIPSSPKSGVLPKNTQLTADNSAFHSHAWVNLETQPNAPFEKSELASAALLYDVLFEDVSV